MIEVEIGARVRSLDPGPALYGTVDDFGGSVPDGVYVVSVTWDDGTRERRLLEEVDVVGVAS